MGVSEVPPVAIPLIASAVNAAVFMAIQHLTAKPKFFGPVALGFAAGLAVEFALDLTRLMELDTSGSAWSIFLGDLTLYVLLGYLFFHVVNMGRASIRVRILREIASAGPEATEAELLRAYSERTIVQLRLDRMVAGGVVEVKNGRYVLRSGKLMVLARTIRALKQFLLRRASEFE